MDTFLITGLLAFVFGAPATPFAIRKIRARRAEQARHAEDERLAGVRQRAADEQHLAEERERRAEAAHDEAERLQARAPVIAEGSWIRYTGEIRDGLEHAITSTRIEAENAKERAAASEQAHVDAKADLPDWLQHSNWQRAALIAAATAVPVIGVVTFLDYNIFRSTNKFSTAVLYAPSVTVCLVFLGLIFGWAVGWHRCPSEQTTLQRYWRGVTAAGAAAALALLMGWLWHIAPLRSQDKTDAVTKAQQSFTAANQQNAEDKARDKTPTYSKEVIQGFTDKVDQAKDDQAAAAALDRGSVLITSCLELVCVESAMLAESVLDVRRRRRAAVAAQNYAEEAKNAAADAIANLTATDHQATHAIFAHLDAIGHPEPAVPVNAGVENARQLMMALDTRRQQVDAGDPGSVSQADGDDRDDAPEDDAGLPPAAGAPTPPAGAAPTPLFRTVITDENAPLAGGTSASRSGHMNGYHPATDFATHSGLTGAQAPVAVQDQPGVRHVEFGGGEPTPDTRPAPDSPTVLPDPPSDIDSLF